MKIIYNKHLPIKIFSCLNIYGWLFIRSENKGKLELEGLNYENIRTQQQQEIFLFIGAILGSFMLWEKSSLLYYIIIPLLPFLLYALFNLIELIFPSISNCMEREAFENESNLRYIYEREPFAFLNYLKRKKDRKDE